MTKKADSSQSGSAQCDADFGEDSRILALDAAEKPVEQTGWRRGWDSDPRYGLTARKLFILRNATNAKIAINADPGYTAGTRRHLQSRLGTSPEGHPCGFGQSSQSPSDFRTPMKGRLRNRSALAKEN